MPDKDTTVIIISGHSAIGKSTIAHALLDEYSNMGRVITATTRDLRPFETEKDYIFLTKEDFEKKIQDNGFLEYSQVYGYYYGVLKSEFEKIYHNFSYTLLVLDPAGAQKLTTYTIENNIPSKSIFLLAKNTQSIKERMLQRGDSDAQQKYRFQEIKKELKTIEKFDEKIYNDSLDICLKQVKEFIFS